MSAIIIDGKYHASLLYEKISNNIKKLKIKPKLGVVLVGNDPASETYVKIKMKRATEIGVDVELFHYDSDTTQNIVIKKLNQLNEDNSFHGILVQMPLPEHLDKKQIIEKISSQKDVDGFSPINVGRLYSGDPLFVPCTPLGIMHLIKTVRKDLSGLNATVIGRSAIVGRPTAELLLQANCSVTILHSHSTDLSCIQSDIVVAAAGIPGLIKKEFIKKGAIVIDVGISKNANGNLVGDVDFNNVRDIAGYITPMPGGVGPMTVAYLLWNVVKSAKL